MKSKNHQKIPLSSFFLVLFLCFITTGKSISADLKQQIPINQRGLDAISKLECDNSRAYKFVVLGDSRSYPKKFAEIIELTNSLKPKFVIHLGDIVERGERKEFVDLMPLYAKIEAPLVAVPGNHEIPIRTSSLKNFNEFFGKNEFTFDYCGVQFILVDNSRAVLTKTQLARIENDMKTDKIRMVFMHAPPDPPWSRHTFKAGAKELVNIIQNYGCEYAFFGHVHGYDHRMIGEKCNAYITGGAGAELNGYGFAKEIYHVLLVTVKGRNVKVEMIPLGEKKASADSEIINADSCEKPVLCADDKQ